MLLPGNKRDCMPQSEVIRAIMIEDSPCCCLDYGAHRRSRSSPEQPPRCRRRRCPARPPEAPANSVHMLSNPQSENQGVGATYWARGSFHWVRPEHRRVVGTDASGLGPAWQTHRTQYERSNSMKFRGQTKSFQHMGRCKGLFLLLNSRPTDVIEFDKSPKTVGETVILLTPPSSSPLKRLPTGEGGAADRQSRRRLESPLAIPQESHESYWLLVEAGVPGRR